ncbi:MAG: MFS transporter [Chloroflexi bacterium]|nr:MFS transporter [Chloroflexota bacterium]
MFTVAALGLGWLVLSIDRSTPSPILSIIGRDFGLSGAEMGAIASAYFFPYVAMQVPAGVIGDRVGLKKVLVAMYLVIGVGALATGLFAVSYSLLLTFAVLRGLGAGAFFSGAYGITMQTVPAGKRGISTAIVTSGASLGMALGLALPAVIYLATDSWRAPFLLFAVPLFAMAIVLLFALGDIKHVEVERGGPRAIMDILKNKDLMLLNVALFCVLYGHWTALTWGASLFAVERGMRVDIAGFFAAIIALSSIPGVIIMGRLSDTVGRKRLSAVLLLIGVATIFSMAYFKSPVALIVALVLYGLVGSPAWAAVSIAWVGDHVSAGRRVGVGTAMGVTNTFAMSASVVAPVVSGWVRDRSGSLEGAFYLAAVIVLLGALLTLIPGETVKRRKSV